MSSGKNAIEEALKFLYQLKEKDLIYLDKRQQVENLKIVLEESLKNLSDFPAPNGQEWKGILTSELRKITRSKRERIVSNLIDDMLRERNT